mmetsp:Transcript_14075/g.38501  ORF Transcript_14075/g.38501 Transcript_14075/m.38501 type:complete len:460 (+) Transcript_14075:167-1546(+)
MSATVCSFYLACNREKLWCCDKSCNACRPAARGPRCLFISLRRLENLSWRLLGPASPTAATGLADGGLFCDVSARSSGEGCLLSATAMLALAESCSLVGAAAAAVRLERWPPAGPRCVGVTQPLAGCCRLYDETGCVRAMPLRGAPLRAETTALAEAGSRISRCVGLADDKVKGSAVMGGACLHGENCLGGEDCLGSDCGRNGEFEPPFAAAVNGETDRATCGGAWHCGGVAALASRATEGVQAAAARFATPSPAHLRAPADEWQDPRGWLCARCAEPVALCCVMACRGPSEPSSPRATPGYCERCTALATTCWLAGCRVTSAPSSIRISPGEFRWKFWRRRCSICRTTRLCLACLAKESSCSKQLTETKAPPLHIFSPSAIPVGEAFAGMSSKLFSALPSWPGSRSLVTGVFSGSSMLGLSIVTSGGASGWSGGWGKGTVCGVSLSEQMEFLCLAICL